MVLVTDMQYFEMLEKDIGITIFIVFCRQLLKELKVKKLLIEYPESIPAILNLSPDNFEHEAKMALAVKLYEMGRLTSGQAASLASISRVAFLLSCKHYGSASVEWDQEELEAEFLEARR